MNLAFAREKLKGDNSNEIIAALHVLKDNGSLSDLPDIMALTKHDKAIIQKTASITVCTIIREKLVSNFNDLEPDLRKKLGALMGSLNPAIVSELSKDIYSEDNERRLRAVQTLGLLKKNPQIRTLLAKLVTDRDEKIRATAVNLLGKMIGPNDQEVILSLLNDKDKRVRANTVESLESLGNKRMVPILQRFRKDPNNRIRGNVLKALYTLDTIDINPDLLDMIETQDNFMMASALWVITQTKVSSPVIEDAVGHCMLSDNEMVLDNARKALTALNSPRSKGYLYYLGDLHK
jgi:hypothetical protein